MAQDQFKRKFTTIFSADVAGYSRLMQDDEAATVEIPEQYKGIMSELIRQHRCRVVDSPGDNLLAGFARVEEEFLRTGFDKEDLTPIRITFRDK
jgi:adenylate cyclase